jgi:hypothetical protein
VVPSASLFGFQLSAFSFPRWFAYGLSGWVAFLLVGNEAWYRSHESQSTAEPQWAPRFPTNLASAHEIPVSQSTREALKCDKINACSWEEPDGNTWTAYYFEWSSGKASSRVAARHHRPDYCLPASGRTLKADLGISYLPANGLQLPFRTYLFDNNGRPLYVFYCLWEQGARKQRGLGGSKYLDLIQPALAGQRRLGQQILELIVTGYPDVAEAERAVRERLPQMIQVAGKAGPDSQ